MRMTLVPIKNAILFSLEEAGGDTGIGEQMLMRWAKLAEIKIGMQRMYRKLKVLNPLESNFIDPPEDAISLKYVYDGDVTSEIKQDIDDINSTLDDDDAGAIEGYVWTPLSEYYVGEDIWDIQGGQIVFNTEKVGQVLTLDYWAFPTNNNDDILVPEHNLDAISFYVQYRMARTLRWKMFRDPKMIRAGEMRTVEEMKKEWLEAKADAIAENTKITPHDKVRIDIYKAELTGAFIYNFED